MRLENGKISIRDFSESDLPLILKWLTDDRVLEYYEDRDVRFTPETLSAHYLEELPDGFRVIIEYGNVPVGYGQIYRLSGELFDEYGCPDDGSVVFAMDQFIGEPDCWNRGIGTAFLQMIASYLETCKAADRILLDPRKNNPRAVRAYQKAGFRIVKSLPAHEMHEGKREDCWLMEKVLRRPVICEDALTVRRILPEDAKEVSDLIVRTLTEVNSKDYSAEYIEKCVQKLQPEDILERAEWTHFYVVCRADRIVGCGAIGPYWGHEDESSLFTVFVLPDCQGKGIGRKIIETLERDEFFLRARRVEIPASITAVNFYRKLGYDYKNGVDRPDGEQLYRLEKFR